LFPHRSDLRVARNEAFELATCLAMAALAAAFVRFKLFGGNQD